MNTPSQTDGFWKAGFDSFIYISTPALRIHSCGTCDANVNHCIHHSVLWSALLLLHYTGDAVPFINHILFTYTGAEWGGVSDVFFFFSQGPRLYWTGAWWSWGDDRCAILSRSDSQSMEQLVGWWEPIYILPSCFPHVISPACRWASVTHRVYLGSLLIRPIRGQPRHWSCSRVWRPACHTSRGLLPETLSECLCSYPCSPTHPYTPPPTSTLYSPHQLLSECTPLFYPSAPPPPPSPILPIKQDYLYATSTGIRGSRILVADRPMVWSIELDWPTRYLGS